MHLSKAKTPEKLDPTGLLHDHLLRLEDFFDALVISSDYKFRKPDPRMFHIALAMLDAKPSVAAYIGNRYETDLVGAKAAGLAAAGLIRQSEAEKQTYGQGPPPDFVTGDLRGAWDWISKNSRDESEAKPVKES